MPDEVTLLTLERDGYRDSYTALLDKHLRLQDEHIKILKAYLRMRRSLMEALALGAAETVGA